MESTPAVLAAALAVLLGGVWLLQRRLIYFPTRVADMPVPAGFEAVAFDTADGLTLQGWFRPGDGRWTVLVFPGNAGNRADRVPLAWALVEAGCGVLLVDYRGYGDNSGRPSEDGLAADARAARRYLDTRCGAGRIVYFGESLGAAVAVGLATERPPDALVLRSPFTSLPGVARVHYPLLPTRLMLRDRYPSLDRIACIRTPLLVVAGARDSIVPAEQSRALFEAAPGPKQFLLIDGAGHNDVALTAGSRLVEEIVRFLETAPPG